MSNLRQHTTYLQELQVLISKEFTSNSWEKLRALMAQIGIEWPDSEGLGKQKYVDRELSSASISQLEKIARWYIAHPELTQRNADFEDSGQYVKSCVNFQAGFQPSQARKCYGVSHSG